MGKLDGRVAAVTGGTAGIGLAIAEAFFEQGASVLVNGRSAERCERVVAGFGAGGRAAYHPADVSEQSGAEGVVDATVQRFGRIDILVNNAGGAGDLQPVVALDPVEWDHTLRWNLYATFWATKRALPDMLSRSWGRVINISSVEGKHGKAVMSPYVAAKHAVNGFTKSVAREVGPHGVTVNALCPGLVLTDIVRTNGPATAAAMGLTFEEMVELFARESAIKRPNTAQEVARAAVLLASELGGGITGSTMSVDGGTAAY